MKERDIAAARGVTRRATGAALAGLWLLGTANVAVAAPTSTKFEPTAVVQGVPLVLNGAGARYRAVFKVYELALYVPRKVKTPEDLLALPGPKRLNFTAMRELDSTDIGLAFIKGMKANATREQTARHVPAMSRLIEIFSSRPKLAAGDTFAMEFQPGKGTLFFITGQPQGAPVGDADFFNMVLNIWVGGSPVEPLLKDALLGQ